MCMSNSGLAVSVQNRHIGAGMKGVNAIEKNLF